jgi:hypothetical protein
LIQITFFIANKWAKWLIIIFIYKNS